MFFENWDYNYGTICCSKLDSEYNFTIIENCLDINIHLSFLVYLHIKILFI